jgi:hypothetical protein
MGSHSSGAVPCEPRTRPHGVALQGPQGYGAGVVAHRNVPLSTPLGCAQSRPCCSGAPLPPRLSSRIQATSGR